MCYSVMCQIRRNFFKKSNQTNDPKVVFQEGLSTYLEWIITKSLDNSTEIDELIGEKRREGIMKDSTSSTTIVSEFRSPEDVCINLFIVYL